MDKTYRILQLTSTSDLGGTERMLLHFLQRANRTKFEIEVGSLQGGGALTHETASLGLVAWNLDLERRGLVKGTWQLWRRLRSGHFDLVQLYGLRADTLGRPLARLAGIRRVVSSIRSPDPWRRARHVWLDRLTSPLVTLWISNSEAGRQTRIRREKFKEQKIVTIPNGIPIPPPRLLDPPGVEESGAFEQEFGIGPDRRPRIACIANLRRMKGHGDLIEALPEVLKEFPRLVVLCAGRDDSGGAVAQKARSQGVSEALKFMGFVADTGRLLRQCDLAILPSHWEGCPVSVLEAMALGKPVVATKVGGIPELVRDGESGLLVAPHSPGALARAILDVLTQPERAAQMGRAARARAEEAFSVERMVARIEETYLWLLEKGPKPRT
ncbi:MAG: glycosyltransferase [bacterium]